MALNLEKQLLFYGSYHHNPVNVGIHIVCVPIILLTFFALFSNIPAIPSPKWLSDLYLPLNVGTIGALVYSSLYILMEPVVGTLMTAIILPATAYGHHLTLEHGSTANWWLGGVNAVCWIAQFIGHGKFEGRAPALLDNLVQALFLAPFFVLFEIMFALGYRPELKARLDRDVQVELAKLNAKKAVNGSAQAKKSR